MERRKYLVATGGLVAGTALAGCTGGSTGTLATQVTDQPGDISDFESCVVAITELRLGPASGDDEESYAVDDAEADLVQLQDGDTELADERELEPGEYEYLKLGISGVEATLEGGGETQVDTPGDAPLTFDEPFEIRADTRTVFTADFTPVKRGQTDGYLLQPVASGTSVTYEE